MASSAWSAPWSVSTLKPSSLRKRDRAASRQVALAAGQVGGADLVSGPHRPRIRGVGREKTLQSGNAQVHAGVVGRIGNTECRGNLDEGTCSDALRVLVGFGRLQPLDVAYEIGPGQPSLERLTGLALGLAKVKSQRPGDPLRRDTP